MSNKAYIPEKKAGIWLGHESAYLFRLDANYQYEMITINSGVYEKDISESRNVSTFRRLFFNKDKQQRREHQHMLKYFERITQQLTDCNYIYLFGPGNSKHEFHQYIIKNSRKHLFRIMAIDAADQMPVPQMIDRVKSYFRSLRFEDAQRHVLSKQS